MSLEENFFEEIKNFIEKRFEDIEKKINDNFTHLENNIKKVVERLEVVESNTDQIVESLEKNTIDILESLEVVEINSKEVVEISKRLENNTKEVVDISKRLENNIKEVVDISKLLENNTKEVVDISKRLENNIKDFQGLIDVNKRLIHEKLNAPIPVANVQPTKKSKKITINVKDNEIKIEGNTFEYNNLIKLSASENNQKASWVSSEKCWSMNKECLRSLTTKFDELSVEYDLIQESQDDCQFL